MNGAALAGTLADRGLDAAEVEAKRRLFDILLAAFHHTTSRDPEHAWWVPGRLEVFGKHTDYAGGRTLVAAVPRGFAVAAGPRQDAVVRVVDGRTGEAVSVSTSDPPNALTGWRHYVEVVVHRLARNFAGRRLAGEIVFASDLPPAAGMSSSSALMVSIATALGQLADLESTTEWRENIRTPIDAAGYYGCVENGSRFGTLDGDAGVGTHGGSEDHAAMLTGRARHLSGLSFVPMRELATVRVPGDWCFVLAPSGVAAEKTGAAKDSYNALSLRARALLDVWNAAETPAVSLAAALSSSETAASRLRDLAGAARGAGFPSQVLQARLDHFIREDARIPAALDAFARSDASSIGRLSAGSQTDAETLLGNQIPETIALAERARRSGAFAASSFGAGFGGSVWALVGREHAVRFAEAWHPDAFVATPGPGRSKVG